MRQIVWSIYFAHRFIGLDGVGKGVGEVAFTHYYEGYACDWIVIVIHSNNKGYVSEKRIIVFFLICAE